MKKNKENEESEKILRHVRSRVSKKVTNEKCKKGAVKEQPIEEEEAAEVEILRHWKGKDGIFELNVFYVEDNMRRWEKLYDMWHDYPDEVTMYRRKHSLKTKY